MVQGILWGGANNWHALSCRSTGEDNSELNFKDCVMTLNWLTLYDIYPVLSVRWGYYEEYIGPTVIEYGKKMAIFARKKSDSNWSMILSWGVPLMVLLL